jgi:phage terminase large subunit-like protein
MAVSAMPNLASRDSVIARTVLTSSRFEELMTDVVPIVAKAEGWDEIPKPFKFKDDENLKTRFTNTYGGTRSSFSIASNMVGENADYLLLDDLVSTDIVDAPRDQVDKALDDVRNKLESTVLRRIINPTTARILNTAQRVDFKDTPNMLITEYHFNYMVLPMVYERNHPRVCEFDPRQEGELLAPHRFNRETIDNNIRMNLAKFITQDQQKDLSAVGGMFDEDMFKEFFDSDPLELARHSGSEDIIFATWDTASSTKASAKYTAVYVIRWSRGKFFVLDIYRARLDINGLLDLYSKIDTWYPNITFHLIERASSGAQLLDLLNNPERNKEISPGNKSKVTRAEFTKRWLNKKAILFYAQHLLYSAVVTEHTKFPKGSNINDLVDAMSQACEYFEIILGYKLEDYESEEEDDDEENIYDYINSTPFRY